MSPESTSPNESLGVTGTVLAEDATVGVLEEVMPDPTFAVIPSDALDSSESKIVLEDVPVQVKSAENAETLEMPTGEIEITPAPLEIPVDPVPLDGAENKVEEVAQPVETILVQPELSLPPSPSAQTMWGLLGEYWTKARVTIFEKRQKKLDRIIALFGRDSHVECHDVEKLLHTTDRTARKYLSILETQGKVRQMGKAGPGVYYERV